MLRLKNGFTLILDDMPNTGCNNGNYPEYCIVNKDGVTVHSGITCKCGRGCNGTDCIRDDWGYRDTAIEQYRMTPEEEAAAEEADRIEFPPTTVETRAETTPVEDEDDGDFKKEETKMKFEVKGKHKYAEKVHNDDMLASYGTDIITIAVVEADNADEAFRKAIDELKESYEMFGVTPTEFKIDETAVEIYNWGELWCRITDICAEII